jgi:hypothetical protein
VTASINLKQKQESIKYGIFAQANRDDIHFFLKEIGTSILYIHYFSGCCSKTKENHGCDQSCSETSSEAIENCYFVFLYKNRIAILYFKTQIGTYFLYFHIVSGCSQKK